MAIAILATIQATARSAFAADPSEDECLAANGDWGKLRDSGKLRDARSRLLVCAASSCPAPVREECTKRIDEVNAAIPTVVLEAKDGAGNPIVDVKVTLDGQPFAERLDGKAVSLDPGAHTFVFATAEGRAEQKVFLKEGGKDVSVSVVIAAASKPPSSPPPNEGAGQTAMPPPVEPESKSSMKMIGYGVGGAGLVGIVVGSVFGIVAISQNSSANCHPNDCSNADAKPDDRKSAQKSADVSTIAFIAGGVLTAGGVAMVLFAPSETKPDTPPAARWEIAPRVGSGAGGLWLTKTW